MKDRATHRLGLASTLMRLQPGADTMAAIRALPPDKRDHLRGLVDWVEDYELHEHGKPAADLAGEQKD